MMSWLFGFGAFAVTMVIAPASGVSWGEPEFGAILGLALFCACFVGALRAQWERNQR